MATRLTDSNQLLVTPDEAAAISELWNKRQRETENLYPGLSIQDIADTMGIPPSEVEIMLRLVRNTPQADHLALLDKKKKRRRRLLIVGAVAFWLTILVGAFSATYAWGQRIGRGFVYYPNATYDYQGSGDVFKTESGAMTQSTEIENYIPSKTNIEFQGYSLDGSGKLSGLTEDNIEYALSNIIQKVIPPQSGSRFNSSIPDLSRALQTGDLGQYSGSIQFEEMIARANGKEIRVKLPVNVSGDRTLQTTINSDVRRRLRIFANQTWRLSQGKSPAK